MKIQESGVKAKPNEAPPCGCFCDDQWFLWQSANDLGAQGPGCFCVCHDEVSKWSGYFVGWVRWN
jgi:hypothetical protein